MTSASHALKCKKVKLSRGEICVANIKAPLRMVRVWTGFNGQLGHLYNLGDWKTAANVENLMMPKLNNGGRSERLL